jgi:alkylation response protein AidB-like acyl-CoA dehydrogenase
MGTPIGRGYRKPRESTFPQVSIVTGDTDGSAFPAKVFTIFEGMSEIQRMIIGRAVTGLDVW